MKLIPLTGKHGTGKFAIVDDEDADRVNLHMWCLNKKGYVVTSIVIGRRDISKPRTKKNRITKSISLHRYVMNAPKGTKLDHADHNKQNCQKYNLRYVTDQQNAANVLKSNTKEYTSKYKGVCYEEERSYLNTPWQVYLQVNHKNMRLGHTSTEEEGAYIYDIYSLKLNKEFAWTNFPKENYKDVDLDEEIKRIESFKPKKKGIGIGLSWSEKEQKWKVHITINKKKIYFGKFTDLDIAMRTHDLNVIKLKGKKALTNFPVEDYNGLDIDEEIRKINVKRLISSKKDTGVNWDKSRNKWQVDIRVNKKTIYIGRFVDIEDARKARKEAEEKYFK